MGELGQGYDTIVLLYPISRQVLPKIDPDFSQCDLIEQEG